MTKKPTYGELEQKIKELEKKAVERKQVEEALRESEEKYWEIASNIPGVVYQFILKKDGSYTSPYMSESAASILDISAQAIMANPYTLFNKIVKEDLDSVNQSILESAQTMKTWLKEFRIKTTTGEIRWMHATSTPHLLPDGEILWNGVILDISDRVRADKALQRARDELETQVEKRTRELARANEQLKHEVKVRKQAEETLSESEEKYRTILESIEEGYFEVDLEGNLTFFNDALCKITGYTRSEVLGMNNRDYTTPETAKKMYQIFNQVYRTGKPLRMMDYEIILKDGKIIVLEMSTSLIRDPSGAPVGFRGVIRDITSRRKAEKSLKESEEKYRTLSEQSTDSIYITTREGKHSYINQSFLDLFGYTRKEIKNLKVQDFYANPKDRSRFQQEIEKTGSVRDFEVTLRKKDGTEIDCLITANIRTVDDGSIIGYQGIIRDITEKKNLESQLLQAQKMEAVGTLAGGIAHNFNNLLMSIQGNTSLMLLDTNATHPHYERLTNIEKSVQSGSKLTSQLLGYARGGGYEVKPISINHIITDTSSTFAMTRKDITLHHDLARTLAGVKADRGQIEQVVLNIYVNAAEAMGGGGELFITTKNIPHTQIEKKSYTIKPGNYILLTIRDTGIGMDKATQAKVFDPFFTTKGLAKGTGLGLASVYGIMKAHGGYIDVESHKGHGTTFFLYLPASKEAIGEEAHPAATIETGKETILLVDDEEIILDVGEALLTSLGYTVLIAHGGNEAIETLRTTLSSSPPDLVILDMIMPGMGGGETYDRMKEIHPTIKVLLSSGYSVDGQAQEILKRGCDGFLQKPFTLGEVSKAIREVVGEG
jgi:two-component system cell cycle sensor histidine kinase/response regulator CckA